MLIEAPLYTWVYKFYNSNMAGIFLTKQFGQGQLAGAKATLYTCPASTTAIIKSITLTNTDSSARTVNLYVSTGTSRRVIPKSLTLGVGDTYEYDLVTTLEATHLIEGDASVANVIDYVISGIQET